MAFIGEQGKQFICWIDNFTIDPFQRFDGISPTVLGSQDVPWFYVGVATGESAGSDGVRAVGVR